jgi:hypothetical protein
LEIKMADFSNLTTTLAGKALISGDLSGRVLSFTKMQAGDGTIIDDTAIPPLTAPISPKADMPITKITDNGDGTVTLTAVIASANVETGFDFRELGIMATLDGANETMFCYSNAYSEYDYIPGAGEASQVINSVTLTIIVDTNATVTCVIGDSSQIDAENIGPASVGAGWFAQKTGTVLQFKRLVQGPGIIVAEDPDKIQISQSILAQNVTLYVAPGNPDITPNFSTINNAVAYLKQFRIPAQFWATINVSGDTFIGNATVDHVDALRIQLIGAPRRQVQFTAINPSGGYKVITVTSNTGLYVGQLVYLNGGTLDARWRGGCQIVAIGGLTITLTKELYHGNDFNTPQGGLSDCYLLWFPTVIKNGQVILPYGIGNMTNFTCYPGNKSGGIYGVRVSTGPSALSNIMSYYSSAPISIGGDVTLSGDIAIAEGVYGLSIGAGGSAMMRHGCLMVNSQEAYGIFPQSGGVAAVGWPDQASDGVVFINGCQCASLSLGNATLIMGNVYYFCNKIGLMGQSGGSVYCGGVGAPMYPGNNNLDLQAIDGAFIGYSRNGGATPSCSPAANTNGNSNSYIRSN